METGVGSDVEGVTSPRTTNTMTDRQPADGGAMGRWNSVVSAWICWMMWGGIVKALGVQMPVLESQFAADAWLIGWIVAMTDATIDLAGTSLV